jgi:uncharacterized protein
MTTIAKGKKTLVIGASTNPHRYAYQAVMKLKNYGHEVVAYGKKDGSIDGVEITHEFPTQSDAIDTVTMYIGDDKQAPYYDQIIKLKPQRVIFNPGTENSAFYKILNENGIAYEEACTLVKLSIGTY